jgi:hypothetical protein
MLVGDKPTNPILDACFPLIEGGEYDFVFSHSPWPIAMFESAPNSLKRKIAAAIQAEFLGLKSVDGALRTYGINYDVPNNYRLDRRIKYFVEKRMAGFDGIVHSVSLEPTITPNTAASLLTLSRASFSFRYLSYCGQCGALFESLALARLMLEQLAWSFAVAKSMDSHAPINISATRSIHVLKKELLYVGRFYGWLSAHSHWEYTAHKKAVISRNGKVGHQFASSYYKAIIFAAMVMLVYAYYRTFWMAFSLEIDVIAGELGSRLTSPELVRAESTAFLDEISACDPSDVELRTLAALVAGERGSNG